MQDFYQVLGVDRNATPAQIKAAFKRMAKVYHPDRNPGDPQAEERFKIINEAYHTLTDPIKKSRYDSRFYWVSEESNYAYWQDVRRKRYEQWRKTQDSRYRIDRNYFKIQGLAFLVFLIIAGFCFGVIHTAHYYVELKYREKQRAANQKLRQVNALFGQGRFEDAFQMITVLEEEDPLEYRFGFVRDSLIRALRLLADQEFKERDFNTAITHYGVLKKNEHPARYETLENLAWCQYHLGDYRESLKTLKHLLLQQPGNPVLIYQVGLINLEKLDNPNEALHYFTLGKKNFKDNFTRVYGKAFEIVMDPGDAPDVYFHIFQARATTNLRLGNYEEAATDCNWAIFLRPGQGEPYLMRAQARIQLSAFSGACDDLAKAVELNVAQASQLQRRYCH